MPGLSPLGFEVKRLQEIREDLLAALRAEFGADILTGSDSAFGRLAGIFAERYAELWELAQDDYSAKYPASADGVGLDNVLDLNGLRRLEADFSRAWQVLIGDPGTLIPAGSRVSHATTGARFATETDETLDLSEPNLRVELEIDGEPHGVGETFTVTVDGVTEVFTTVGGETDLDVAQALATLIDPLFPITDVDQALRTFKIAGDQRNRFGLVGKRLRVTGASGSPSNNGSYTIIAATLDGGDTVVEVAQELPSDSVSGSLQWNCRAVGTTDEAVVNTFLLLQAIGITPNEFPPGSTDASDFAMTIVFVGSIPANFTLAFVARATEVLADETGPTEADVNTLSVIETPVTGWLSTTNPIASDPGRDIEPDVDARQRRQVEVRVGPGPSTPGLVHMLLEVPGVDAAQVFPNETDVIDVDGRPPHSVECVVSGGRDSDVAVAIFNRLAAGIQSFGNTVEIVVDTQGVSHAIRFSRAVDVPIWVDVDVVSLYAEETLPALAAGAITQAIVDFGRTFRGGLDVIPQRLSGAIFAAVPGLSEITVEVGITPATGPTPVSIAAGEIARFDDSRVTVTGL